MIQHNTIIEAADPAFEQLKSDVDRIISSFQDRLVRSVTNVVSNAVQYARQEGPQGPQGASQGTSQGVSQSGHPKSLPWFKYGVRGFLNKLWHGDSSSNPNYQTEGMTLESYIHLEEKVDEAVDIIIEEMLCEAGVATGDLQSGWMDVFKDFRNELFVTIQKHLAGKGTVAAPDAKEPQSEPEVESQPETNEPEVVDPKDIPPSDNVQADSVRWWNHAGKQHFDNEETPKIVKFLDRHRRHETYRRIFAKKRDKAVEIMKEAGLDPNKPEDIKLVWPWHLDVPIRGAKVVKGASALESEDHKTAMRILEGAKPSTMATYYKMLLESRR